MRRPDPVEIAAISIPVLCEVVAVLLALAGALAWMIILATPAVPV